MKPKMLILAMLITLILPGAAPAVDQALTPGARLALAQDVPDNVLVDVQPGIRTHASPAYPKEALAKGLEGKVWVKVLVDTAGLPARTEILKSDDEIFNASALAAAQKFTFTPAKKDGKPVAVWITMPFKYKLSDKKDDRASDPAGAPPPGLTEELRAKVQTIFAGGAAARPVIAPEAWLVDGGRFVSLHDALFGKEMGKVFAGEQRSKVGFMKVAVSNDGKTATMILKTGGEKKDGPRWHTVAWTKEQGGEWRVTHWHTSR